uniref:RRM domain-containing protein n=1 Tax=Panagrellus redivivus TaxID=6233 RepID=A0A7E4URJ9_PANRE
MKTVLHSLAVLERPPPKPAYPAALSQRKNDARATFLLALPATFGRVSEKACLSLGLFSTQCDFRSDMSRHHEYLDAKVYVGGLPDDARSEEVEEVFRKYGKIRKVWVARRPPGFAFVEFVDVRDAEDAVKGLDGARICGVHAKVELSHGKSRGGGGGGRGGGRGGYRGGDRGGDRRGRSPGSPRRRRSPGGSPRRSSRRSPSPRRSRSRSPRRDERRSAGSRSPTP